MLTPASAQPSTGPGALEASAPVDGLRAKAGGQGLSCPRLAREAEEKTRRSTAEARPGRDRSPGRLRAAEFTCSPRVQCSTRLTAQLVVNDTTFAGAA